MRQIILVMSLSILSIGNAHAYLDPGTGSILLQGLLAGLLAIGAFWRNVKLYIWGLFSKKKSDDKGDQ